MNQESETLEFFGPLLTDPSKIKREAVRMRKQFDEKSIVAEEIPEYEADGWQVDRGLIVGGSARRGHDGGPQGPLCHWLMAAETSPGWQVSTPAA